MAKRKAKKLTKSGRERTGSARGSGKRRSDRAAGARPAGKRAAGGRMKRAGSGSGVTRARRTRPTARKNLRSRASSVAKPRASSGASDRDGRAASGRRSTRTAGGPAIPLRDLIRGGAPRSPKAHRPPASDMVTPWTQRRSKSAHGLRSGTTIYQAQQSTRERYGGLKFSVPKRG